MINTEAFQALHLELKMSNKKSKKRKDLSVGIRSLQREAHFKAGGSLAEWRGIHAIHKHKGARRLGGRSKQKNKAIKESLETSQKDKNSFILRRLTWSLK